MEEALDKQVDKMTWSGDVAEIGMTVQISLQERACCKEFSWLAFSSGRNFGILCKIHTPWNHAVLKDWAWQGRTAWLCLPNVGLLSCAVLLCGSHWAGWGFLRTKALLTQPPSFSLSLHRWQANVTVSRFSLTTAAPSILLVASSEASPKEKSLVGQIPASKVYFQGDQGQERWSSPKSISCFSSSVLAPASQREDWQSTFLMLLKLRTKN